MAKPINNNPVIMWVIGALIVGGLLGYLLAQSRIPSQAYMTSTASMIKDFSALFGKCDNLSFKSSHKFITISGTR